MNKRFVFRKKLINHEDLIVNEDKETDVQEDIEVKGKAVLKKSSYTSWVGSAKTRKVENKPKPARIAKHYDKATQCNGTTKKGHQCRNKTVDSSGVCHIHRR